MIELIDDGTLDTVVRCTKCGKEFRGTFTPELHDDSDDYRAYVEWLIEETTEEHECGMD